MIDIDYHIEFIRFPSCKTHEAVTLNEDGSATIFLNRNDTKEMQTKRFWHAIRHLKGDDFEEENVQNIEEKAHGGE
ncbi:putative uncharacterized protein [Clostridium sp. CAG:58]|nr:putative uncharacterized protein [Clostridium sp. CAG:58]